MEGQPYVAVGTGALDAQRQSVPVDREGLDADRAVQAVGLDQAGQPLDRVAMAVGEVGEQPGLGGGQRIGCGGGELVEVDDHRAGRQAQHHARGPERQVAVLVDEPSGDPQPGADAVAHGDGRHVGELQDGGRLPAGRADRGRDQGAVLGHVQQHPTVLGDGVRADELLAPALRGHRAGPRGGEHRAGPFRRGRRDRPGLAVTHPKTSLGKPCLTYRRSGSKPTTGCHECRRFGSAGTGQAPSPRPRRDGRGRQAVYVYDTRDHAGRHCATQRNRTLSIHRQRRRGRGSRPTG